MRSEAAGGTGFGNRVWADASRSAAAAACVGCPREGLPPPWPSQQAQGCRAAGEEPAFQGSALPRGSSDRPQARGDGPASPRSPPGLPAFTRVFCTPLPHRAGPAVLLGPSGPICPLASPVSDANYSFSSAQSYKSHRFFVVVVFDLKENCK